MSNTVPPSPSQDASPLDSTQRKALRGMAHSLKPSVHLGKSGLSDGVLAEIDQALEHHELIKVRLVDLKDQRREVGAEVCRRLDCELVGTIGHVLVLFRQARDPDHRQIRVPAGRGARSKAQP